MALRSKFERLEEITVPRRANPKYPNFIEGFPGVACSDTSNPPTFRSWAEAADQLSIDSPNFGEIWTWGDAACAQWPGWWRC